jgi:ferredoxin
MLYYPLSFSANSLFLGVVLGVVIDRDKCCYCGGCSAVCPANCLELKETRMIAQNEKCINCMACVRLCPVGAIVLERELKEKSER